MIGRPNQSSVIMLWLFLAVVHVTGYAADTSNDLTPEQAFEQLLSATTEADFRSSARQYESLVEHYPNRARSLVPSCDRV